MYGTTDNCSDCESRIADHNCKFLRFAFARSAICHLQSAIRNLTSSTALAERDEVGEQLIRAVGAGRQLPPQAEARRRPSVPCRTVASTSAPGFAPWLYGKWILQLHEIADSADPCSPRKYSPRSWTQFFHAASLISFGVVKQRIAAARRTFTGANSSVTRFELTLRRVRAVLRVVELELVVLDDQRAAVERRTRAGGCCSRADRRGARRRARR